MSDGTRAMWMRGGTSKGVYFLGDDLPDDIAARDAFLLSIMGSPDPRQINGIGGADPLASKVGIVRKSARAGVDVDYLFLQVYVDQALVSDAQNCGNILAGIGPFAIERGLVEPMGDETRVRIYMENTDQIAVAVVQTPNGVVTYQGDAMIDGVPRPSAPIPLEFQDTAGSMCGALLPTGDEVDVIDGIELTMIDNGMPCVIMRATDFGITGTETREELDGNEALRTRLETIRLACGPLMNLGDVRDKTVPKMTLVSAPQNGGAIMTRSFIPHRCHASIGVLAAVTVASACLMKKSPAYELAAIPDGDSKTMQIEHPIGATAIVARMDGDTVTSAAILRTARKLFDGRVFHDLTEEEI
ncbi:4-oxalomesaconate tautomerase [Paramylibacter ulvae]|nr:4-oxalomesaconate tautomerase [Amylibacter ulvae]